MPASPTNLQTDILSYNIKVGGKSIKDAYQVVFIEVEKAINRIPTAQIVFNLPLGAGDNQAFALSESADFVPGKPIEIAVGSVSEQKTIFKGIIVNQSVRNDGENTHEWMVRCSDEAVKMTLSHQSKNFVNMTDSDTIASIIGDYGLSCKIDSTTITHKQLVQYQCNDWDFIIERAEANGLLVYAEDGKISLSATQDISLSSSGGNVSLAGLNVEAKAKIAASVQGTASAEIKSTGQTTVKGAMVMIN